tara:strand:- start:901 stop:1041 length:141 start_codon:yes stop_codon:yes gene_type:complete
MPLPKPNKGEKKEDFISRCVKNPNVQNEFKSTVQKIAVCYKIYNEK